MSDETFPPARRLPDELADVMSKALIRNSVRHLLARAELELDVAVDAALAAGHSPDEVRQLAQTMRLT